MYDLSEYVKTLKQKYTQWHNNRRGRKGTLWEERFKSIMIQPDRAREGQWDNALLTMAAYIDLNAVRAGIVADPKDYRLKRKTGARSLRKAEVGELCTMRDLRMEVISPPKARKRIAYIYLASILYC